jgi:hypothetical protein
MLPSSRVEELSKRLSKRQCVLPKRLSSHHSSLHCHLNCLDLGTDGYIRGKVKCSAVMAAVYV